MGKTSHTNNLVLPPILKKCRHASLWAIVFIQWVETHFLDQREYQKFASKWSRLGLGILQAMPGLKKPNVQNLGPSLPRLRTRKIGPSLARSGKKRNFGPGLCVNSLNSQARARPERHNSKNRLVGMVCTSVHATVYCICMNYGHIGLVLLHLQILMYIMNASHATWVNYLQVRVEAATTIAAMLEGQALVLTQVAEYKESSKPGSFTTLSCSLGQILMQLHTGRGSLTLTKRNPWLVTSVPTNASSNKWVKHTF